MPRGKKKELSLGILPLYVPSKKEKITKDNFDGFIRKYLYNLEKSDRECVIVVLLNSDNRYLATDIVAIGSALGAVIPLKNLLRKAIIKGASKAVIVHNHPSGNCNYSDEDKKFARRSGRTLKYFDIQLEATAVIAKDGIKVYAY